MRFQTEGRVLRVNKSKITGENTFKGDHYETEGNMDQVKTNKFCFGCFCRFVTSALTLRQQKIDIYVFRAMFGFCIF